MPIYEFQCASCDHKFDELVSLSVDLHKLICPQCGANSPRKLMSAFGFSSGGKTATSVGSSGCTSCHATSCSTCKS